jgi:ABC-type branched-subunit amino acid transport system ATPase component
MEQKNKNTPHISNTRHNRNVKTERKLQLKIKYYNGLLLENESLVSNYLKKYSVEIEQDFMEDKEKYEKILSSTNKNFEIYNKKLKEFEEARYWERRKTKTKIQRTDSENLTVLMEEYDANEAILKEEFLKQLEKAYPVTPYSKEEIELAKKEIEKLEAKKQKRLAKLDLMQARLAKRIEVKNSNIKLRLDKLNACARELKEKIQKHNEDLIEFERIEIQRLKEYVGNSNLSVKEKEVVKDKINYLDTKITMTQNEDIQLSVRNLKMYFGGIKAVNDVSFDIKRNEIFGLIGPNGAGKTTVFNCITQFYKATSGVILYRNKENNIVNLNKLKPFDIIKEGIARSFQNVELIWELSVLDNLLVAAHSLLLTNYFDHMFHTSKAMKEEEILKAKALKILSDLQIIDYAYRFPYGLPYGILKKIELARTLMTDPSMIILDEPAAGLNEAETKELAGIIKKINKDYQTTIFLVEHDMSLVMSICDKILAISFGKELAIGTPKEIQNNEAVRVAYLGEDD